MKDQIEHVNIEQTDALLHSKKAGTQDDPHVSTQHTRTLQWSWQDALYLFLLLAIVVWMAFRYTPNITGEVAGMWWDPLLNIWTMTWDVTTLLHAPAQLWQAPLLYPNHLTLSYSENLLGDALLFAPFYLLTHNPVFAFNMVFYLSFLLCGTNMYLLARYYTGKPFAAFVAALIYAFAPYRIGQIDHIHVVAGEWIPLAFLYLDRALQERKWRHWSLFALFYLLQMLSSIYYGIFLTYTLIAYLLFQYAKPIWRAWRRHGRSYLAQVVRFAVKPAVVFGVVLVLLAVLMTPYLLSLGSGLSRGIDQSEFYAAFLRDFGFSAPFNWLHGGNFYNGIPIQNDSEHHLFLGWTTMLLAALGILLVFRQHNKTMRTFVWTGLIILLFAFGPVLQFSTDSGAPLIAGPPMPTFINPYPPAIPLPWYLAYFILPGFKGLRVPARLIGVLLMVLALLAAYTVSWLQENLVPSKAVRATAQASVLAKKRPTASLVRGMLVRGVLLLLPLALLVEAYPSSMPLTQVPTGKQIPAVYQWLATHGGNTPIVELPMAFLDTNISSKQEAWYDYYTIYHSHPIADGWSGYRPKLTTDMAGGLLTFPSPRSIAVLRAYHIHYVVVHPQMYRPVDRAPDMNALRAGAGIQLVAQFGQETIWQVMP